MSIEISLFSLLKSKREIWKRHFYFADGFMNLKGEQEGKNLFCVRLNYLGKWMRPY